MLARTGIRYPRLKDALAVAVSGDTIKVTAGNYATASGNDVGSIDTTSSSGVNYGIEQNTLTIEWETPGSPAVFDISAWAAAASNAGGDGSGIVMGAKCLNLTLRGIHIRGYRRSYTPGNAGLYLLPGYGSSPFPAATLLVEYCKFWEHSNGIITGYNNNFSIELRYCTFQDCNAPDGLSHGNYISVIASLDVLGCTYKTTSASAAQPDIGHLLKSRARRTRVRGSLFDPAGGTARCMDISNGGVFECYGNVLLHYGATNYGDDNFPIAYGAEQTAGYLDTSNPNGNSTYTWANDSRTHSIFMAQNTIRKVQPASGPFFSALRIYDVVDVAARPLAVAQTIRNNIVAGPYAAGFVATWPNNSEVPLSTISTSGAYSGGAIAGNPAVNDAQFRWAGELQIPTVRSDTNRGGL